MQLSTLLVSALALVASAATLVSADCQTTCVRKEFRALSPSQKSAFFNAFKELMDRGDYHSFVRKHMDNARAVHGTPAFFVWHRAFTRSFEEALQSIDSSVCLPYWSWDFDSQAPEASPILTNEYFGGNGDRRTNCVTLPWAPKWEPKFPQSHCLKRQFDGGDPVGSFYSTELINGIIRSATTYDEFRQQIEGAPHSSVHTGIGGDNGDMSVMNSPNDPLFWAHHANIDRFYAIWQQVHPNAAHTYNGENEFGQRVTENDQLVTFKYRVHDVYDTKALCYTYADLPAELSNRSPVPAPKVQTPQAGPSPSSHDDDTRPPPSSHHSDNSHHSHDDEDDHHHGLSGFFHKIFHGHLRRRDDTTDVAVTPMPRGTESFDAYDRTNLIHLRYPKPASEIFMKNNWLDVDAIRQHESRYQLMITQINSIEGYISPTAILNRHDLWAYLSDHIHSFHILLKNIGKVTFGLLHEDIHQGLSNIKALVKSYLSEHKSVSKQHVYERLVSIVGEPVTQDKDSATYFHPTV